MWRGRKLSGEQRGTREVGRGRLRRPGRSAGLWWLWWVEAGGGVVGVLRPLANNSAAVAPATGLDRPLRPKLEREIIGGEEAAEKERKGVGHQGEQESCQHIVYSSVRMDSTAKELLLFTFNYNLEEKKAAAVALCLLQRTRLPMLSPSARGGK